VGAHYNPQSILGAAAGRVVDRWEGGGEPAVWEAMIAKLP
jgi:hypothetical protein